MDPRKEFVLSSFAALAGSGAKGVLNVSTLSSSLGDDPSLNRFLDDAGCEMLQAVATGVGTDSMAFQMANEMSFSAFDDSVRIVHFVKCRPDVVTAENMTKLVSVSSMAGSPLESLFLSIHKVHAPYLLSDSTWSARLDSKTQTSLTELETGLGHLLRSSAGGILTPYDEFKHWDVASRSPGMDRDRGVAYSRILEPVASRFQRLDDPNSTSMSALVELAEDTQDALDSLWKAHESVHGDPYPQSRMAHTFSVVAGALTRYIQLAIGQKDLWTDSFSAIRVSLRDGIRVCEKWQSVTTDLTGTFWSTLDSHRWTGAPHTDYATTQMARRLEQILSIRTTHEELLSLLTPEEQRQLRVNEAFEPFRRVQPLHVNPYTQPAWEAAIAEHDRGIQPVESHVAAKLRSQIAGVGDRPQQLLREFAKYKNLLSRPTILRDLSSERDSLLAQLNALVESMDGEFESRVSGGLAHGSSAGLNGKNISSVVSNIVWAQAIRSKLAGSLRAASTLLNDLPSFAEFKSQIRDLAQKLDVYQKDQFKEWSEATTESLDDGELSLEMTGRVMEFDAPGNMVVNYSDKLVTLLRDTRQLTELGLKVPPRIQRAAVDAEKYYRYGVMLKKVANFYNSMGSQILPIQKPMLLDPLLEFESAVAAPSAGGGGGVTWSNQDQCAAFVQKLQASADRLAAANRALRKAHQRLGDEVVALMNIDLLRHRDAWKARWASMREMVTTLARKNNYPPERMARWLLHWDFQLYKALEVGYRMGLESLNENLSEIKAELIFSQKQLQFRPPLEELRANYYREMKKFISTPNQFTGFGNARVFSSMADRNAASLVQVYRKAEILFARLGKLRERFQPWTLVGKISDLDAYVEANVSTAAEWDANFKMLKVRRKESEKLPDFQKVDCVNVSLAPFKAAIEDHLQRLSDALVYSLRTSLLSHLKTVESYVETSMTRLSERPTSVDEIGKAKREWKEIADSKPAMRSEYRLCDEQKRLLLSVAGSNVELSDVTMRLAKLSDDWENFELAMDAFNERLEQQRAAIRDSMEEQVIGVNKTLMKFVQRWEALRPKEVSNWSPEEVEKVFTSLSEWKENLQDLQEQATTLRNNCESFQLAEPKFEGLDAVAADIEETQLTWNMYKDYQTELEQISGQDWITFRSHVFELQDFAAKWLEKVKGRTKDVVCVRIYEEADGMRRAAPALKYARGEPFKEEHWTQVFKKLGMPRGLRLETLTVGHFIAVLDSINANVQYLKELQSRALGEVQIREALQELRAWAETSEFSLLDHLSGATGKTTSIVQHWKDLFTEIGDNQSLLQSLKESQYFKPFADQALQFEEKLATLDENCQNLNQIQRRWVYLEPIFGRGALPAEQARFRRVDDEYKDIMGKVSADPRVFNIADVGLFPGLADTLRTMLDQLERCQKALADFLEQKRSAMPRFYFIGDDDLLEILGQAKNPKVIQAHLKKLFQGLHKVTLSEDEKSITAMLSVAGEEVPLASPVAITEDVEVWLTSLAAEMQDTLAKLLVDCVKSGESDLRKYPSQVLCLAEQIYFTRQVEEVFQSGADARSGLQGVKDRLQEQLASYTAHDLSSEPLLQLKVKALVLDLIHHMDVIDQLLEANVRQVGQWQWQKQLRFYLNKHGRCVARMCDAECIYTYEYQGNSPKLVHTPLTDKCYLTLTQGMAMGYGGNPYGPAGTGKTESVKALGAALGRQVLVFNCDEGIDFHSMGRIFTGLVKCGAWGCFDEFNRLKEDQLSAVSQQIQVIQAAIKDHSPTVTLLNSVIDVNFNAGIFVTMNPAGKGYGGRSKLPDNLKQLFRPVAMSRPDNELIAEVILYSEGFSGAKDLARKMVALFTLSKQLLSQQQHYDWGLRAMKTCLNTGGKLVQELKQSGTALNPELERETLIKAIRVNTLSKLTYDDSLRFLALVGDIFPGVKSEDLKYKELEDAIIEVMTNKPFNLQADETQVRKMMQLKESLDQRMGCVIVGPSGCGKSTLWRVLQAALEKTGQKVITYVMNPKSMPRTRLLGEMDPDTREWTDGVLTAAARAVVKEPLEVRSWIVCDGDVDPEWIESLNSVLDDNHLLTMPNGERISFGSNINFIFETHDLRFASPATISRMGMIFLSDEDVDVQRIVKCWLARQPEDQQLALGGWMEDMFYRGLTWVLDAGAFIVDTTMVGTVLNGLSHLVGVTSKSSFVCGLIRGLGGNLSVKKRTQFAKEAFSWASERPPDLSAPLDCHLDARSGRLESFVTPNYDGNLTRQDLEQRIVIDTVGVQRTAAMISPWVERMEPFILVGPEGCGKSMLIRHLVAQRKGTSITSLHCNAQTTAEHVIQRIRQACTLYSSNSGRVYRPREGDRLVLFLKDINLPRPDMYATCALIAFLQQLVTFNGFYDENLEFLGLERVHIVCTMNPATTVGRHHLSTRFTAIVRIAFMDYPDSSELGTIYGAYMQAALQPGPKCVVADERFRSPAGLSKLATTMVDLFEQVKSRFSVDEHRHYLFTPRDLTALVTGMLRYDVASEPLLDVLAYEAQRTFRDRLVDSESEVKFDSVMNSLFQRQWKHALGLEGCVYTALAIGGGSSGRAGAGAGAGGATEGDGDKGTFDGLQGSPLERMTTSDLEALIQGGIQRFEREEKELHMLLFQEILDHIVRVDRVLSVEGGSLLLVGRSGVGRRTATTLVAHMHGMQVMSPNITREYGLRQFFADLKAVLQIAGVQGEEVVLYIEDHHIADESILETVNSVLSSGEVPGLYTHEELEPLLAPLKEQMSEAGFQFRTPYEFFVSRIVSNLHVAIGMDPTHPKFSVRCESNPALYTRCTVLWMGEWRRTSMREVPHLMLPRMLDLVKDPEQVVEQMVSIHESCRSRGSTPLDYVRFLTAYEMLYHQQVGGIETKKKNLQSGLSKLQEAETTVDTLSREATEQRGELKTKQQAADEAMEAITEALAAASDRRKEVEILQSQLVDIEKESLSRKSEVEEELASITPILESAKKAVGGIDSSSLSEIRGLRMPPEPIHDVLSAVLELLGISDTSWQSMRRFLGDRHVKDQILSFDGRRITAERRRNVQRILQKKAHSFEKEVITRASTAAAPMALWVKATIRYSIVIEKIQPLEAELAKATANLNGCQAKLDQNTRELAELDARVAELKADFAHRTSEAERLRTALQATEDTLNRAQSLLGKLSGEKTRWAKQVEEYRAAIAQLPSQVLVAAGFVVYLAKSPEDVRRDMVESWCQVCHLDSFDITKLLSSESEMLTWKSEGLPADGLSMQNAIVVLNTKELRCPFIIDPATSATKWLEGHLQQDKSSPLEVVTAQDPRFQTQVELAVRFGKTLLILEVDTVDPMLYPLVRKDLVNQGPRLTVQIGEKAVDYNEKFRLFMATRNPRPDLPPSAASLVTEVNFTVTRSGLEGQLLGVTLQHEQPELEKMKSEQLQKEEELKVQIAALEAELIEALASSTGNILENQALIDSLTKTKVKAADIEQSLAASAEASRELDRQRDVYRPFAAAGSALFFLIQDLRALQHMYQFSLSSYVDLFSQTLSDDLGTSSVEARISSLINALETRLLFYVGRSLFKEDRLMYAMHMVHLMHPEMFKENEWRFFVGDLLPDLGSTMPREFPAWAPPDRVPQFKLFVQTFPMLVRSCQFADEGMWGRWARSPTPERDFPSALSRDLSAFQRVLVIQTLRPDRLVSAMQHFATDVLKVSSVTPPPTSLAAIADSEASCTRPVLMITTTGADPSKDLEDFAAKTVGRAAYSELAMGGGQQAEALRLLRAAAQEGKWLCLKNLHLVIAWLPVLEKELNILKPHERFRLWLTTEAHDKFPTILLQHSVKVTFEAPPGIRKNLERTYEAWSPEFLAKGSVLRAQMLFVLAWFHAVLQERRTYVPQGWTKAYEFSFADLRAGVNVVEALLDQSGTSLTDARAIPWKFIHGLMENAIYGGRVDNMFDMRVLVGYLRDYFNPDVVQGRAPLFGGVVPPNSNNHAEYMGLISGLSDSDSPMLFALPENIERSVQRAQSSQVIASLKSLSVSADASLGFDREKWREALEPLLDMWAKITSAGDSVLDPHTAQLAAKEDLALKEPVHQFVIMEHARAATLVASIDSELQAIKTVVFGTGLLTPAIQSTAAKLMAETLPSSWTRVWEGPEDPKKWLRAVVQKRVALSSWADMAASGSLLKSPLHLSELLRPETFLNALRQQTARGSSVSMDNLKLVSAMDAGLLSGAPLPVTLTGMSLQGAMFDGVLSGASSDTSELVPLPSVCIAWVPSDAPDPYPKDGAYLAPVYHGIDREGYLVQLSLPIREDAKRWTLAGVAVFLEGDSA